MQKKILNEFEKKVLNEFGRKILRKIYGSVLVNGQGRNRYNREICNLHMEMELARAISLRRLHWVGRVMRVKDDRVLKKALKE